MTSKKELLFASRLAIVLLLVGAVSYAAYPVKTPDEPIRMAFKASAGKVMFDHQTHTVDAGYGLACNSCHHTLEEGDTAAESCGACHEPDGEDPIKRADAFHQQCIGCHQDAGSGPVECTACHVM